MLNALYCLFFVAISLALGHGLYALISGLPPSLYGMMIFTVLLHFRICHADKVAASISWGIRHMGVCFVPAGVGIINHYQLIQQYGVTLIAITFLTTFFVLTLVGICVQQLDNRTKVSE